MTQAKNERWELRILKLTSAPDSDRAASEEPHKKIKQSSSALASGQSWLIIRLTQRLKKIPMLRLTLNQLIWYLWVGSRPPYLPWGQGPAICVLPSPPGGSNACSSLRTAILVYRKAFIFMVTICFSSSAKDKI